MQIDKTVTDGKTVITPVGSINTLTSSELEPVLAEAVSAGSGVTLDFSQVSYISSAGLRVLLSAHKALMAKGEGLTIRGASDEVREVFEVTGLIDLFNIE